MMAVLLSDCVANPQEVMSVGDAVPTAPWCSYLIFLLLHGSSRQRPANHLLHGKADSSAASGHCCNLCLESPISPADTSALVQHNLACSPHSCCTTLSTTLIYTTPHYPSATETNSKLGNTKVQPRRPARPSW